MRHVTSWVSIDEILGWHHGYQHAECIVPGFSFIYVVVDELLF